MRAAKSAFTPPQQLSPRNSSDSKFRGAARGPRGGCEEPEQEQEQCARRHGDAVGMEYRDKLVLAPMVRVVTSSRPEPLPRFRPLDLPSRLSSGGIRLRT